MVTQIFNMLGLYTYDQYCDIFMEGVSVGKKLNSKYTPFQQWQNIPTGFYRFGSDEIYANPEGENDEL